MAGKIYTIGHSNMEQERFLQMLKDKGATLVVDVRSMPYSRFVPQFNKETLESALKASDIGYAHEPDAFGARQKDPSLYNREGYLDFETMRSRQVFRDKVSEYAGLVKQGENVVLMCSEKDPKACHRAIMVARGFALSGMDVGHILSDGKVMSQKELDDELVQMYFPEQGMPSLFPGFGQENNEDFVAQAYALQNKKIGYKLEDIKEMEKDGYKTNGVRQWSGVDMDGTLLSTHDRIASFRGKYGFLSNMYDCPVTYKGVTYGSSEAAYQAQRPVRQEDRDKFVSLSGVEAKRLVDKLEGRKDWHAVNVGIMEEVVRAKFTQNPDLAVKLAETTGKELVEGNKWRDTFWGVYNGRGRNTLGEILMKVRRELSKEKGQDIFRDTGKEVRVSTVKGKSIGKNPATDEYVIAVTGHRPHLLFGYDWKSDGNQVLNGKIGEALGTAIKEAEQQGFKKIRVVTGMALGTDQMFMAQAQRLAFSKEYRGKIVTEAAVPFQGQETKWNAESQKLYNTLLSFCDTVTVVSRGGFSARAMQARNEYMVDKADVLLSVYDGKSMGGTKNCIDYAEKKGVPVKDVGLPELLQEYPRMENKKRGSLKPRAQSVAITNERA